MRLWPFRRRRALVASAASTVRAGALRPGEFPPNEWQIGADLEQWLPQRAARSQTRRARASSGRGSFLLPLLVLVALAVLVYFVFLAPNGVNLSTIWNNILTFISNIFLGPGSETDDETETEAEKHVAPAKHVPPALITSTPLPAEAG